MKILWLGASVGFLLCADTLLGQGMAITSVESSGRITWTCPSLNVTCRVQRATSLVGPGNSPWTNRQDIFVTNPSNETVIATPSNEAEVAMFCRVAYEMPDPHFPDITAEQSLALIAHRNSNTKLVVLDVRTASEYAIRHITNALNLDFYSPTFSTNLDALDKNKVYLIYCASGNRSGQAHDTMLTLGFHEVYNMLGGISTFQSVPGAGAYLEP